MKLIFSSQLDMLQLFVKIIDIVSIFISVILGFLIIYANKYLIRRRKKELGIYMTLGMEKGKISKILLIETIIIGIFSLAVGLFLGIALSQGLSVLSAKMFEVDLTSYKFVFSQSACLKTILYFGIMFLFVMIFNSYAISKYKLISLLQGGRKNESLKIRKLWISVVIFIVSIVCLVLAYHFIIKNGMMSLDKYFFMSIVFGAIGTLLFFFSLSGFLLKLVQANRKLYLKNLNMFILRQINSKINTTFISMTVICLMLLVTIGTFSTGMGLSSVLMKSLQGATPYDVTFTKVSHDGIKSNDISAQLKKAGLDLDKYSDNYESFSEYQGNIKYATLFAGNIEGMTAEQAKVMKETPVPIVKLSDYNKMLRMQGIDEIKLKDNEYVLNANYSKAAEYLKSFLQNGGTINFNGQTLQCYGGKLIGNSLQTSMSEMDVGTIIVNDDKMDSLIKNGKLTKTTIYLNMNFKNNNKELSKNFEDAIHKFGKQDHQEIFNMCITKKEMYDQGKGLKVMVSYLAIYIGIIFLITSAAVLALQQLSESSDNVQRYGLLRKIGVERSMINSSLLKQIAIYFFMPLGLAIVHSIVGLHVANNVVNMLGHLNIVSNTVFTAVFIVVIYGGYFLATYFGSKSIINGREIN